MRLPSYVLLICKLYIWTHLAQWTAAADGTLTCTWVNPDGGKKTSYAWPFYD